MTTITVDALVQAGFSAHSIERTARLLSAAANELGKQPHAAWWVPGRVEVLGKHTDYAGGLVLNCATDVGMMVVACPRTDNLVTVTSAGRRLELPLQASSEPVSGWGTYVATVVRRLAKHFPHMTTGADIAIAANLPAASGMSSSSAVVIGMHHALAYINNLHERADYRAAITSPDDLVVYLGCHENGASFRNLTGDQGVGTAGGSQDHAAIVRSRAHALNIWNFAPLHLQDTVTWPKNLSLSVAVSGILAEKTSNAREGFNRISSRAKGATAAWNKARGRNDANLGSALAVASANEVLSTITDADLRQRAEQMIFESQTIIPAAVTALKAGDFAAFGAQVAHSQRLAETHLGNQVPETIDLVRLALEHGAVAASAFGAGFGGSVWAAFKENDNRSNAWLEAYRRVHPHVASSASLHTVHPGPGCTPLHASATALSPLNASIS